MRKVIDTIYFNAGRLDVYFKQFFLLSAIVSITGVIFRIVLINL